MGYTQDRVVVDGTCGHGDQMSGVVGGGFKKMEYMGTGERQVRDITMVVYWKERGIKRRIRKVPGTYWVGEAVNGTNLSVR